MTLAGAMVCKLSKSCKGKQHLVLRTGAAKPAMHVYSFVHTPSRIWVWPRTIVTLRNLLTKP